MLVTLIQQIDHGISRNAKGRNRMGTFGKTASSCRSRVVSPTAVTAPR